MLCYFPNAEFNEADRGAKAATASSERPRVFRANYDVSFVLGCGDLPKPVKMGR